MKYELLNGPLDGEVVDCDPLVTGDTLLMPGGDAYFVGADGLLRWSGQLRGLDDWLWATGGPQP